MLKKEGDVKVILLCLIIIISICNCATTTLSEKVKKQFGDISKYSDKELIDLYTKAVKSEMDLEMYLKELNKKKKIETQVRLEGYIPYEELEREARQENAIKILEQWREVKRQVLEEMKKRKLSPPVEDDILKLPDNIY